MQAPCVHVQIIPMFWDFIIMNLMNIFKLVNCSNRSVYIVFHLNSIVRTCQVCLNHWRIRSIKWADWWWQTDLPKKCSVLDNSSDYPTSHNISYRVILSCHIFLHSSNIWSLIIYPLALFFFYLSRHDFSISSSDLNSSIQTGSVVSFYNISSKNISSTNSTVIRSLWSWETSLGPT